MAATNTAWWPQIKPLAGTDVPNELDEDDEEEAEEAEDSRHAPVQESSEERHENMRAQSDLGHRLMVHGAETMSSQTHSSPSAPQAVAGQGSPGSGIDSMSGTSGTSSLFEKLDSDASSGAESTRDGSAGAQGKTSQGAGQGAKAGLTGRVVCVFDNRGVGRSSYPVSSKNYRYAKLAPLGLIASLWSTVECQALMPAGLSSSCYLRRSCMRQVDRPQAVGVPDRSFLCFARLRLLLVVPGRRSWRAMPWPLLTS